MKRGWLSVSVQPTNPLEISRFLFALANMLMKHHGDLLDALHMCPGTELLPVLFCLSLLVTLIATPLAAEFLLRSDVPR